MTSSTLAARGRRAVRVPLTERSDGIVDPRGPRRAGWGNFVHACSYMRVDQNSKCSQLTGKQGRSARGGMAKLEVSSPLKKSFGRERGPFRPESAAASLENHEG